MNYKFRINIDYWMSLVIKHKFDRYFFSKCWNPETNFITIYLDFTKNNVIINCLFVENEIDTLSNSVMELITKWKAIWLFVWLVLIKVTKWFVSLRNIIIPLLNVFMK
jgi:hypothetical protein